jgi:phage-related protein
MVEGATPQRRRRMNLLHGFIEKTQKTPRADLGLAIKRKTELN